MVTHVSQSSQLLAGCIGWSEFANLATWLASEEARYAAGQLGVLDGGLSAQVQQPRLRPAVAGTASVGLWPTRMAILFECLLRVPGAFVSDGGSVFSWLSFSSEVPKLRTSPAGTCCDHRARWAGWVVRRPSPQRRPTRRTPPPNRAPPQPNPIDRAVPARHRTPRSSTGPYARHPHHSRRRLAARVPSLDAHEHKGERTNRGDNAGPRVMGAGGRR